METFTDLRARRAADFGGLFREGVAVVGILVVPFGRIVVLVGVAHHGWRGPGRRPRTDHGEIGRGGGSRHEGAVRVAVRLNLDRYSKIFRIQRLVHQSSTNVSGAPITFQTAFS